MPNRIEEPNHAEADPRYRRVVEADREHSGRLSITVAVGQRAGFEAGTRPQERREGLSVNRSLAVLRVIADLTIKN